MMIDVTEIHIYWANFVFEIKSIVDYDYIFYELIQTISCNKNCIPNESGKMLQNLSTGHALTSLDRYALFSCFVDGFTMILY